MTVGIPMIKKLQGQISDIELVLEVNIFKSRKRSSALAEYNASNTDEELLQIKTYIIEGFHLIRVAKYLSYAEKSEALDRVLSIGAISGILPGWRPKAITEGALKLFIENNFKLPKGLERAHEFHRRHTIKALLEEHWENEEWWEYFEARDYTVLATRSENRREGEFSQITKYSIPIELNLFKGKRVGFTFGEAEKNFLIDLATNIDILTK